MTKPSIIGRGLVILISLMLLVSTGGMVFANQKVESIEADLISLQNLPQSGAEQLPNLQFDLVAPEVGWLATEDSLYWTDSNGDHWQEITPTTLTNPIVKVEFVDAEQGWLIGMAAGKTSAAIELFQTSDGGATWQDKSSNLQEAVNQIEFPLSTTVYSQLTKDGQGWLLFKYATGVNFSLGELLYTNDGGDTWMRREAQSGEPTRFIDAKIGYQLEAHGTGLLSTQDGGITWQAVDIAVAGLEADTQILPGLPSVAEKGRLVLPIYAYVGQEIVKTYLLESNDQGKSWFETKISLEPTQEVLRGEPVLQTMSASGEITQWQPVVFAPAEGEQLNAAPGQMALDQLSLARITSTDGQNGWGLFSGGGCLSAEDETKSTCMQGQVLATTLDGGLTWTLMPLPPEVVVVVESQFETTDLPNVQISTEQQNDNTITNTTNWQLVQAQGFDTCTAVNMSKMSSWRASSPYRVYGLYIGGSMAYCPNTVFDATSLRLLFNEGWRFIPTWVGPQAPCTDFLVRFSLDPTTAYNEGVANANQAVEALKIRGMTNPDGSGSVIYYDLERFPYNATCQAAARSFLKGWTTRLHQTGNKAGLYATSTNINVNQFYTIDPVLDAVWIAEWYWEPYFRPWVTVFNVDYLPSIYWANSQRIYQYTGAHAETWGGVTMSIDNNVIDGMVAVPYSSDITLPVSNVTRSGTLVTTDLYKSAVTVTLSATDNVSGINAIYYNLNNTEWKKYTTPFSITGNQTHILQYRAVDGVYNWEAIRQTTFKIDTIAPGHPVGLKWSCPYAGLKQAICNNENFTWSTATDNLSGLKSTYVYWGTNPNGTINTLAGNSFDPPPIADKSTYFLRFSTVDLAGNQSAWRTLYTLSYDTSFTNLRFFPLINR